MDVPYWTGKSCTSLLNPPSIKSEDDINNKEITRLYELSVDLEILKHMHA